MSTNTTIEKLFISTVVEGPCKLISLNNDVHYFTTDEILLQLEDSFKIEKAGNGVPVKLLPSHHVIDVMNNQLTSLTEQLLNTKIISDYFIRLMRCLRNFAATSETRSYIVCETDIMWNLRKIFNFVLCNQNTNYHYLKVPLQFIINLVSSNEFISKYVFIRFKKFIQKILYENDHIYECSALVYNISRFNNFFPVPIIEKLICFAKSENHNEYIDLFMEHIVKTTYFWETFEKDLSIESKIIILLFIKEKLLLSHTNQKVHCRSLDILSNEFKNSVEFILKLTKEIQNDLKAYEVSLILEVLSSCSSKKKCLNILQTKKDLFMNAGVLLLNVHKLGKLSDNCFTPVQKLSKFDSDEDWSKHPAFGFKADLIRLIGNLCWKNAELQKLVRTAELIPVVLDCCNMDANNPSFNLLLSECLDQGPIVIIQWCILAIRNICAGNIENQEVIANLHQQGTVTSDVLDKMGITLHTNEESHLKIVSFDDLKKKN